jgi:hypothetical protein
MKRLTAASEAKPDLSNAESETLTLESDPLWGDQTLRRGVIGSQVGRQEYENFRRSLKGLIILTCNFRYPIHQRTDSL